MEILNENLNHYLDESGGYNNGYSRLNETATPMWMSYMGHSPNLLNKVEKD